MAVSDIVRDITKKKLYLPNTLWKLTTTKHRNGSNLYYVPEVAITSTDVKITDDDVVMLKMFNKQIEDDNTIVANIYLAKSKKLAPATNDEATVVKALDADFDDSVDDIGSTEPNILQAG
jgi:hypothetical protein